MVRKYSASTYEPIKEMSGHMTVHGTEGIVQKYNVSLAVGRPGKAHSLLLTAAQVDPVLSYLGLISRGENLQV